MALLQTLQLTILQIKGINVSLRTVIILYT